MPFDVQAARIQFPSLQANSAIFLDNPAGTQVPQPVIDAVSDYYRTSNANSGGVFRTSIRTDELRQQAREAAAALLNAARPDEIIFGANMTSLTFSFGRAYGRNLKPGDEIVLTQMDHDANVTPWVMLAEDRGLTVRWVRLDVEDGTLDMSSFDKALNENTKLVCVGHAANALGTINPIQDIARKTHAVGAKIYVDAVQSAPHVLVDVQALDVDFLACSAYKFYGPHAGILYGKHELMEPLRPYKVRPAHDENPDKWETGTPNFEGIAGTKAAIEYLASFGEGETLREKLVTSYAAIGEYEGKLAWHLLDCLKSLPGIEIRGIVESARAQERVPTIIFRLPKHSPEAIAEALAKEEIYVWSGNYYAVETMRALQHEEDGGMVRIGIAHYNSIEEIDRTIGVLKTLT
jgi:cysteine desulfurase family protein (TIGR01976 family)